MALWEKLSTYTGLPLKEGPEEPKTEKQREGKAGLAKTPVKFLTSYHITMHQVKRSVLGEVTRSKIKPF